MIMRSHPILSRFVLWVFCPILIAVAFFYSFLLKSLPQTEGTVHLEGLTASVEVIRDEYAIPHINAKTDHDAFFAIGYLHAQDRLWQMNYKRRTAQGRLSEILGIDVLDGDKLMRTYGLTRAAQQALDSLDESAVAVLEAYSAGVNAWINEGHRLPVEFYIFDTNPELWKPVDSVLMIKLMALSLGPTHSIETNFDLLVKQIGLDRANEIMPNVNLHNPSAGDVYAGSVADSEIQKGLIALNDRLQAEFNTGGEIAMGSNAWVVSGEHTATGFPLLAGDPHLGPAIPSLWYLADIKGDKLHVTGATFPGNPLVLMGRNQHVAWGNTNMFPDAADTFVERVNPVNQNQYEVNGEWVDMEIEEQYIHIKSAFPSFLTEKIQPVKWEVRRTRNGPLISDAIGRVDRPLSVRWSALDATDKTFESYLGMNYATDMTSFSAALENYKTPAVNIIYGDSEKNIALFAAGKIPIRNNGNGRLPVPGWNDEYQWLRYIPFEEMPHNINPEEGFIVNANDQNHPDDYPYIIANLWSPPYRAERIREVIEHSIDNQQHLTPADFKALQGDTQSTQIRELLPFLVNLPVTTSEQKEVIQKLKDWNGILTGDSTESAVYQVWLKYFNSLLLADDLRGTLLHELQGNMVQTFIARLNPTLFKKVVYGSPEVKFDWCDQINTQEHESCDDLGLIALDLAIDELSREIGFSTQWEDINTLFLPHDAFVGSQFLNSFFDRSIAGSSDRFSVNRADWFYSEEHGYGVISTAGYRQVIDLSAENDSGFITQTGQSGHVFSEHYDDALVPYKALELWPMQMGVTEAAQTEHKLDLVPAK